MRFRNFVEQDNELENILNNANFVIYFLNNNDLYAAPEEGRIVFARMKDDESSDGNFSGINLIKALNGEKHQNLFGNKELKKIKIIDQKKAEKILKGHLKKINNALDSFRNILSDKGEE